MARVWAIHPTVMPQLKASSPNSPPTSHPSTNKITFTPQAEDQLPFFVLTPGAKIKNVTIPAPVCEGIHMMGDNVLDHIIWTDVGEDAASVRNYFPCGDISILTSEAYNAADKIFQFNTNCNTKLDNFKGNEMGKLLKQMGETTEPMYIDISNINATNVISAVILGESSNLYIMHHNVKYQFKGSSDKSDCVFRDIPASRVTEY